jgi:hypothetical protein
MKRARFFLTAGGKYEGESRHDHPYLRELLSDKLENGQTSLFQDSGRPGLESRRQTPLSLPQPKPDDCGGTEMFAQMTNAAT